jgi:hypothetical protein
VAFVSVNYFDQSILVWFWLVAVICGVTQSAPVAASAPERAVRSPRGDPWMMQS